MKVINRIIGDQALNIRIRCEGLNETALYTKLIPVLDQFIEEHVEGGEESLAILEMQKRGNGMSRSMRKKLIREELANTFSMIDCMGNGEFKKRLLEHATYLLKQHDELSI